MARYPGGPTIGPGSAPSCAATTVTATAASATTSAAAQSLTLQATVSAGGAVTGGTVTFVVLDTSGVQVGNSVSGSVSAGAASATYSLPANTPAGSYTVDAIYTPSSGQAIAGVVGTNTLTVSAAVAPSITSANSATFPVGTAGSLPSGLSLNASTGAISGTPTAADTRLLTLTVRDSGNPQQTASVTLALYVTTGASVSGSTLGTATGGAPLTVGSASSLRAVTTGGSGSLAVATYPGDPVVPAAFTIAGSYFDVAILGTNTFTSVTVTRCGLSGSQVSLVWWNSAAWQAVSPTPTYDAATGCLTFTLSNASSPTLSQLVGTPFAVSGAEETEVTTTPYIPPPGWITVQVLNSRTHQPVLGSVVRIADAPPIPPQTVTSIYPVLVYPALSLTSGYNGTNQYGVIAGVPAGWTLNGPAEQMALVQSAAGTPVVFTADPPPSWARVNGAAVRLWSGADAAAIPFGPIAAGAVLRVDRDTPGQPRLLVYNPATKNWAWVDRTAVTPTAAP